MWPHSTDELERHPSELFHARLPAGLGIHAEIALPHEGHRNHEPFFECIRRRQAAKAKPAVDLGVFAYPEKHVRVRTRHAEGAVINHLIRSLRLPRPFLRVITRLPCTTSSYPRGRIGSHAFLRHVQASCGMPITANAQHTDIILPSGSTESNWKDLAKRG